jgi:cell migration-inducing and hyaluronan-binding protein
LRIKLPIGLVSLSILAFVLVQMAAVPALASTVKPWTGNYPVSGSVTVPAGETVLLDTDVALADLTVKGRLICADKDLSVRANWIMVHGLLRCGTAAAPFLKRLDIALTGSNPAQDVMGMGSKFLGAMEGGRIDLHGEPRTGWTRLAATAKKGALKITLKEAPPWRVGDRIVIVSTDYRPEHAEERRIAAISGNVVTLASRLDYEHWCARSTFGGMALEECAEVGLLSRNIVIHGAASTTTGFGGHVMIMKGSQAHLSGVEFLHMGQKARLGRYPMHWHLVGDAPGQYVKNSSFVHSYNRFVSIHGTHQVTLSGNVGYDTIGHGYYLEDGIEHGNVIANNLGALVRNSAGGTPTPSDRAASIFWISNPDNFVRRNVAAGSEHTGFWLGFPEHPIGLSATNTVWPRRTPLLEFNNNLSHSNGARGLFIDGAENPDRTTSVTWYEPRQDPADDNSKIVPPVFDDFTAYKNRYEGVWLRSYARPVLQSAKLADNWMGAYFASLSGTPGFIQDSLVVGETGNKGNPESWETKGLDGRELPHFWSPNDSVRGIEYYDGPMSVRRTMFANYLSNAQRKAGGITNLSSNPYWVSSLSSASTITFQNANRVWLDPLEPNKDGDAFSVIRDIDGSVTGVTGGRIVPKNPVLYTASCTLRPAWNAYVCPHNYVGMRIFSYGGLDLTGTILKRDDGAVHTLASLENPGALHMVLLENRPHSLTLPVAVPKRITFQRNEGAGKATRVSLPYPTATFTVTLWGSPVEKATDLGELASGGTKYYYDAARKRLHLRLVSTDGSWQEYEVNRP